MAPKGKGTKRAAAVAEANAKRAKLAELEKTTGIVDAILTAPGFPEPVLQMVSSMMAKSLNTYVEDRHPFQSAVFEWAGETLSAVEKGIRAGLVASEAFLANKEVEEKIRKEKLTQAEEAVAATSLDLKNKKELSAKLKADLAAAEKKLKEAVAAQKTGDKDVNAAESKLKTFQDLVEGNFAAVKAVADGAVKKDVQKVLKALKPYGFESELLESATLVLTKPHESYSDFDKRVLEQLTTAIKTKAEGFEKLTSEGAGGKAERADAVAKAQVEVDELKKQREEAEEAKVKAEEEAKEASKAQDAAKAAVTNFLEDLRKEAKALDSNKLRLGAFQEGPLANFEEFKNKTKPPPEEPAVEAEAADPQAEGTEAPADAA